MSVSEHTNREARIHTLQEKRRNRLAAPGFERDVRGALGAAFSNVTLVSAEDISQLCVACTERVRSMPCSAKCNLPALTDLHALLLGDPAVSESTPRLVFSNGTDYPGAVRMPLSVLLEHLDPLWQVFREELFAVTETGNSGIYAERAFFDVSGNSMPDGIIELQRW